VVMVVVAAVLVALTLVVCVASERIATTSATATSVRSARPRALAVVGSGIHRDSRTRESHERVGRQVTLVPSDQGTSHRIPLAT